MNKKIFSAQNKSKITIKEIVKKIGKRHIHLKDLEWLRDIQGLKSMTELFE